MDADYTCGGDGAIGMALLYLLHRIRVNKVIDQLLSSLVKLSVEAISKVARRFLAQWTILAC